MAATSLGARLTEQHRSAQVAVQQSFLAEFLAAWRLLDVWNLDRTALGWLSTVLRLIELFRQESAELVVDYYERFREEEAPDAPVIPRIEIARPAQVVRASRNVGRGNRGRVRRPDDVLRVDWRDADRAARVSMTVMAPVNIKAKVGHIRATERSERNALVERAAQKAQVQAAGAGMRHVIEGSRRTLLTVVEADDTALGWARVTDSDPCAFCALLSSRGAVYKTRRSASFEAHDSCSCSAEPVFSRGADLPGRAAEFRQLWNQNIRGQFSGKEAIREWRRQYEQRQRAALEGVAA